MKIHIMSSLVGVLIPLLGVNLLAAKPFPQPQGELRVVDRRFTNSFSIMDTMIERLVAIDHEGKLAPRLATHWQWLDDDTLEIHLRQGVRFHNGEHFDASVFKLNWDAHVELRDHFKQVLYWRSPPIGSRLEVIDAYTIRVVLAEPDASTLLRLGMRIVNRQFYRQIAETAQELGVPRASIHGRVRRSPGPWGTGPYQLQKGTTQHTEHTPQTVLKTHLDYWDLNRFPKFRRVIFDNRLETAEALVCLQALILGLTLQREPHFTR